MRRWLSIIGLCLLMAGPALADPVTDDATAQALFNQARGELSALGLTIPRDILLHLRTADELNVQLHSTGGLSIEADGFYQPYNPECVWIVSGHDRLYTEGVMAHELTHAWQSTEAPQQDRTVTEGFATWVQYHVLQHIGDPSDADQLTYRSDIDYGKGLHFFLDLEKREGIDAVVHFARTESKIP